MTLLLNSEPPPTLEAISSFEAKIGRTIPPTFVAFLMRNNGGTPSEDNSIWRDSRRDISLYLQYFFPLSDSKPNLATEFAVFPGNRPESYMPICLEGGGSYVLLDLDTGAIFLWDADTEEILPLATSVDQFIEGTEAA